MWTLLQLWGWLHAKEQANYDTCEWANYGSKRSPRMGNLDTEKSKERITQQMPAPSHYQQVN